MARSRAYGTVSVVVKACVIIAVLATCRGPGVSDAPTRRPVDESPPTNTGPVPVASAGDRVTRSHAVLDFVGSFASSGGVERLAELPAAEAIAVCRTALWLDDATIAAPFVRHLDARHLDANEQRRYVDILMPNAVESGNEREWARVMPAASSRDIHRVLDSLRERQRNDQTPVRLPDLHRLARASVIPDIRDVALSGNESAREYALRLLDLVLPYTDQFRVEAAQAIVGVRVDGSDLRARAGIPTELESVLRGYSIEDRPQRWDVARTYWALRWLRDVVPVEADIPLLVTLLDASGAEPGALPHDAREEVACIALRKLYEVGERGWVVIERIAASGRTEAASFALAARVRCGDETAAGVLESRWGSDRTALALSMEISPARCWRDVLARLRTPGDHSELLDSLAHLEDQFARLGIQADTRPSPDFELDVLAIPLRALDLCRLATGVPECHTRRVAARAIELARAERALPWAGESGEPEASRIGSFLELGAEAAFRETLREWAGSEYPELADGACATLLDLGDRASSSVLIAYVARLRSSDAYVRLGRVGGSAVEEYLRRLALSDDDRGAAGAACVGLAICSGIPEETARAIVGSDAEGGNLPVIRGLIVEGRALDAVAEHISRRPDEGLVSAGDIQDPRVTSYLRRLRERRELAQHIWATAELAVSGDPDAMDEMWRAMVDGRYAWMNRCDGRQLTFGYRMCTLSFWISEQESNCCRVMMSGSGSLFESWFGIDAPVAEVKGRGETHASRVGRFVRRWGQTMAWSRVAGCFAPVPGGP